MKKWFIALVSGFILFILIYGGMVVFSHCMAVKVHAWEEAGMTLSTIQIFALQFSFFFTKEKEVNETYLYKCFAPMTFRKFRIRRRNEVFEM